MTELREFNELGISEFRAYLTQLKNEPTLEPPTELLENFKYATLVPGNVSVDRREFASKLEFGQYFFQAVNGRVPDRTLRSSAGLWAWLALFYIDQVCPSDGNGRRKVLSLEKYIPSTGHISTNPDKHLLFFPWKMISLHGDDAAWLLGDPLRLDSKVVRELSNSYRRNVSAPFVKLAKALYFDDDTGRVKRGATTNRPGSLRRLDRVVSQLDLTYDVFGMEAESLAAVLPRQEFGRWLGEPSTS